MRPTESWKLKQLTGSSIWAEGEREFTKTGSQRLTPSLFGPYRFIAVSWIYWFALNTLVQIQSSRAGSRVGKFKCLNNIYTKAISAYSHTRKQRKQRFKQTSWKVRGDAWGYRYVLAISSGTYLPVRVNNLPSVDGDFISRRKIWKEGTKMTMGPYRLG